MANLQLWEATISKQGSCTSNSTGLWSNDPIVFQFRYKCEYGFEQEIPGTILKYLELLDKTCPFSLDIVAVPPEQLKDELRENIRNSL